MPDPMGPFTLSLTKLILSMPETFERLVSNTGSIRQSLRQSRISGDVCLINLALRAGQFRRHV